MPRFVDEAFDVFSRIAHVARLSSCSLRLIQQGAYTGCAVGSEGLPEELADGTALGTGQRRNLFRQIGGEGDRELACGPLHTLIIT